MRVNELAKAYQVSTDTVRYYTRIGILKPQRDPANGYKLFGSADASRLHFAINAKRLGFSIKDIKKILAVAERGDSPCPTVRELITQRLEQIKADLESSFQLYQAMQAAIQTWETLPDQPPTGHTICTLIQNWNDNNAKPNANKADSKYDSSQD